MDAITNLALFNGNLTCVRAFVHFLSMHARRVSPCLSLPVNLVLGHFATQSI